MFSSEDEAVFNNFVSTLKIGTHNINGLRCNIDKLDNLIEFMKLEKIDIMTLTDTNLSSRDGRWAPLVDHARDFSIIWSDKAPDKIKGSGLACIINHKWRKHFWKADRISPYFMNVQFLFKGLIICIWIIYAAPADPAILTNALAHIQKECSSRTALESPDKYINIVTGDFNKTINGRLDRSPQNDSCNASIFSDLSQVGLGDAFRAIYPDKVEFSWSNGSTSTRIDYIWIHNQLFNSIIDFHYISSASCTNSDHSIALLTLDVSELIPGNWNFTNPVALDPEQSEKRMTINYHDVEPEHWKIFQRCLDENCRNTDLLSGLDTLHDQWTSHLNNDATITPAVDPGDWQTKLDHSWSSILRVLLDSVIDTLPIIWAVPPAEKLAAKKKKKHREKHSVHTARLSAILHKYLHLSADRYFTSKINIDRWTQKIVKYNKDYLRPEFFQMLNDEALLQDTFISQTNIFSPSWFAALTDIIKHRQKWDKRIFNYRATAAIRGTIERRFEYIQSNQSGWLASVQEKDKRNICVDRLVEIDEVTGQRRLLLDPHDIKQKASSSFAQQFRKRSTRLHDLSPFWTDIYTVQHDLEPIWESVMDEVTLEEWHHTVSSLSNQSTAGPSGIDYRILKNLPDSMIFIVLCFINLTLKTGIIPALWKISNVIPIPKPNAFHFDILNTRPIALLDTFRKTATKILTRRISLILSSHQVLKGANFCGLKGEDTTTPLATLQNVLEDAREFKKELWVMTQDMKKACDSISIDSLRMALSRISLPKLCIDWILNLFLDRELRIITFFGLSPSFVAGDGIDQGDSISPLLWRIFYDPLLTALQQSPASDQSARGYHMSVDWPADIQALPHTSLSSASIHVPTMAYMDDTIYLDSSKARIQSSIYLANEFFLINDIFINGLKCELLVLNPSVPVEERYIIIGQDSTIVKESRQEIRYLGVWFAKKKANKLIIIRLKDIVASFTKTIQKKCIGIG